MSEMHKLPEIPDVFPISGFSLFGLDCLNDKLISSAGFVRSKDGNGLDVCYLINNDSKKILSAPFEQFASDEAYLSIYDENSVRRTTITMVGLELDHLELVTDGAGDDAMHVLLSYSVKSFSQA